MYGHLRCIFSIGSIGVYGVHAGWQEAHFMPPVPCRRAYGVPINVSSSEISLSVSVQRMCVCVCVYTQFLPTPIVCSA